MIAIARLRLALRKLVCLLLGHDAAPWGEPSSWTCPRCFRRVP